MRVPAYIKRLQLEIRLARSVAGDTAPHPPPGSRHPFAVEAWHGDHAADYAEVLWKSFVDTIDAEAFPDFQTRDGCSAIIDALTAAPEFCADASLSVGSTGCRWAVVQSAIDDGGVGWIRNLAVVPMARGNGLARHLLCESLRQLQRLGVRRVRLEVSARNRIALCLYHSIGFQFRRTLYREFRSIPAEYVL